MSRRYSVIICVLFLMIPVLLGTYGMDDVRSGSRASGDTILYVDGSGGSTYTNIQDAVDDAGPHTTIIVNSGNYDRFSISGKGDLTIRGNSSSPDDVIVAAGLSSSPAAGLSSSSNITLSFMQIVGGLGTVSVNLNRCNNITLLNLKLSSLGSSMNIWDSEDVSMFFLSAYNPIGIYGSRRVAGGFVLISSDKEQAKGLSISSSSDVSMDFLTINMTGSESVVLYGTNSDNVTLLRLSGYYENLFAELHGGSARVLGFDPPSSDLAIYSGSLFTVENERIVLVRDETNTTVIEGVDLKLSSDGEVRYSTEHFGGSDPVSDQTGRFLEMPPLIAKAYRGANTSSPVRNDITLWYGGGDVERELFLKGIDANVTQYIYVLLPDFEAPDPPQNATIDVLSEDSVRISFDGSNSSDAAGYRIYGNDTGDWRLLLNTTSAGSYTMEGLVGGTEYWFRLVSFDDSGIESEGIILNATTLPPTKGTIQGHVSYDGGPQDGVNASSCNISIHNGSSLLTYMIVGEDGNFLFRNISFGDGYLIRAVPTDAVMEGGNVSGYTEWNLTFNLTGDMNIDIAVPFYNYTPEPSGTLSGRVVYYNGPLDGENAANITVTLFDPGLTHPFDSTVTDGDGRFVLDNVSFGDYIIVARPVGDVRYGGNESGYTIWRGIVNFTEDRDMFISLRYYEYIPPDTARISGNLTFSGGPLDGEAAPGSTVEIYKGSELVSALQSDAAGTFASDNLPYGSYIVVAIPPDEVVDGGNRSGYTRTETHVNLTEDTSIDMVFGYYDHSTRISHPEIVIVDEEGNPLEDVVVKAAIGGDVYKAVTDENGRAVFTEFTGEFPDGTHFSAEKNGYGTAEWDKGEDVPPLKKEEKTGNDIFLYVLLAAVIILLMLVLLFAFRKKGGKMVEEE